ncbi:hypothetical protein [Nonomuraea fuscirosea]
MAQPTTLREATSMTAARNSQPCSAGTYVMSPHQRVSTAAASGVRGHLI